MNKTKKAERSGKRNRCFRASDAEYQQMVRNSLKAGYRKKGLSAFIRDRTLTTETQ